jgi:excisionase family DNA binding protein
VTLERYLTAKEVGALLQVSEKTVHRWATEDSTMPALRLGGGKGQRSQLRFHEERLAAWLRTREQGIGRPRSTKLSPSSSQVLALPSTREGESVPWANGWAKKPAEGQA